MLTTAPRLSSDWLSSLSEPVRRQFLESLSDEETKQLLYDWRFWARPNQLAPEGQWRVWLALAGRGFGKTRMGAEWVRAQAERGHNKRIALVAPTAADARDVMVEGESGILAVSPPWNRPRYEPSKRRLTWPSGNQATLYSAEDPDQLRGPQHSAAWCDEIASWKYPASWDMLLFGLRLGRDPRVVVTTTPRPTKEIKRMLADPTCTVTRGSTFDNRANLAPVFFETIISRYEGTRLGRQEVYAEILDDNPGALWHRADVDEGRVSEYPELRRIVVAVDPAVSNTEDSDETGIVVAGVARNGHAYVLDDMSLKGSPNEWGMQAVAGLHKYKADRIVAENNNGGDMVEHTIRTVNSNAPYKAVHASRGKVIRAEPVAALYEQGKVHHVGSFPSLEDQLCQWEPGMSSPDRLDALVWALTDLMLGAAPSAGIGVRRYA
jgi:phage terminase large subunit-like protein